MQKYVDPPQSKKLSTPLDYQTLICGDFQTQHNLIFETLV
jgi:hypothetical protein